MLAPASARSTSRRASFAEPLSGRRTSSSARSARPVLVSVPRSQRSDSISATPTRYRSEASISARQMRSEFYESPAATKANAMKVYIRVRPFSEREIAQKVAPHSTVRIDAENPSVITILEPARAFRPLSTHIFNRCFWSVFENAKDGTESEQSDIRNGVDTFLNGGMNSARRSRAQSLVTGQPVMNSVRRGTSAGLEPEGVETVGEAAAYDGAGSAPVMVDANVSHPPYAGQDQVYMHVGKPIVGNTLDGYNGCVFAYGQTGSGKTFTMLGYAPSTSDIRARKGSVSCGASSVENSAPLDGAVEPFESDDGDDVVDKTGLDPNELQGVIPRACTDLFDGLRAKRAKDSDFTYRVEVSYYEIYNEKVFDLIRPQRNTDLRIRNSPNSGPFIEGLTWKMVSKEEDVARVIRKGMQERHTAATKFNDRSSRSHAILTFNIVQLSMDDSDNAFQMRSKLNLVDLAGSERTGAAGAEGNEFHDGVKINQSLTVLGRVIDRLADLSQNKGGGGFSIPYRDSNLTWVLSDSIGGNSQTSMIATVSPHSINYEEMRQTIRYASRAKNIINWVKKNEDPQVVLIRELREQVVDLEQRLKEAGGSNYTNEYVQGLERKLHQLEKKCADQERIIAGLRAQLEFAGIADPTVAEGYLDPATRAKEEQQRTKAEENMRKQLDKAQITIAELRAELEHRGVTIEPESLKAMKEKLQKQDAQLLTLTTEVSLHRRLRSHCDNIDTVMELVKDKETLLLRACNGILVANRESAAILEKMLSEREDDLRDTKRLHEEELATQAERFCERLKEALDEGAVQQQQLLDRHRDAVAQLEGRLRRSHEINEMERKRNDKEKEEFRQRVQLAQERMRDEYQQEIERLRARVEGDIGDRHKSGDAVRQLQDMHEREMERLRDEMNLLKRSKDSDCARLQNQLENERLRRESDLMEKDRQMRLLRNEVNDAKRTIEKLSDEKNSMEKEYQGQIRDLMLQQEQLLNVSNAVLSGWEDKSSALEADLHKMRALVYDKDYMNFRQNIRGLAFMERVNFDEKLKELDEKERLQEARIRQIISKARRAYDEQNRSLKRFEQDIKDRIGRAKAGDGSSDTSLRPEDLPSP